MPKIRVIPSVLWNGASAVKGAQFNPWRVLGPVNPAINVYIARNVDELLLHNIATNIDKRHIDYASLARYFKRCNIPLTYGGGIRSISQVEKLLEVGVDKISVCTLISENPNLIKEIAQEFGSQFIVGALDYKLIDKSRICFTNNGASACEFDLYDGISKLQDLGVGEILITSIEREGCMTGYDLETIFQVRNQTNLPLLVNSGAWTLEHFKEAADIGVDGLVASSAFLFSEVTPRIVAEHLIKNGHNVRIPHAT